MQVYFSDKATDDIVVFFDFYSELYFRLYDDTGLGPAEEYIKKSYADSAILMRDGVYDEIESLLSQDHILGYVPGNDATDMRLVTRKYGNYRLFIEYREIDLYRIIEGVRIYRK